MWTGKRNKQFALLACLFVAASSVVAVASPAVASTAAWTAQLDSTDTETILTHASGKVSVGKVSGSGSSAIQTIDTNGDDVATVAAGLSPDVSTSQYLWDVGTDDTIYTLAVQQIGYSYQTHVVAYRGGVKIWDVVPPDTCSGQVEGVAALKVGADGNVYVASDRVMGCTGMEFFLSGFDHTDGSLLFSVSLGGDFPVGATNMITYASGIALLSASTPRLRYYDYAGNMLSQTTIPLVSGEWTGVATGTHDGRVYVSANKYRSTTAECPWPWTVVSVRLMAFGPEGQLEDGNSEALQYNVQDCATIYPMATPNGGVALMVRSFGLDDRLLALDANLHQMWDTGFDLGDIAGRNFASDASHTMFADNNGNIVTTTLYTRQNQTYRGMQFSVFNGANGLRKAVVYTDQLNANVSFNVSLGSIGLAQNTLYISAHICGSGLCSGSDTLNLYAIPVTGLGMDYPRARVQGVAATTQTSRKYVALGDSFSAGESVEPFSAPSDSDGCHRSTQAYAELLDQDPALNLDLQAFAACSGATTATVAGGMNGESSQLDSLSTDDDVVTITVGGNDAKFVDFATECFNLTPGSHCDGSGQYDQTMGLIENSLPANLDDLFDEVKGRIGESTRVLVVGYPRLMPYVGDPLDCAYLSTQERTAIMDVTNGLNGALRTAAQNAGSQFEFVDADAILDGVRLSPFAGHELCASDNYFNGATLPVGYSYHPNRQGQAAYEELVRDYLLNGSNIG